MSDQITWLELTIEEAAKIQRVLSDDLCNYTYRRIPGGGIEAEPIEQPQPQVQP